MWHDEGRSDHNVGVHGVFADETMAHDEADEMNRNASYVYWAVNYMVTPNAPVVGRERSVVGFRHPGNDLQLGDDGVSDPLDQRQTRRAGGDDAIEIAERIKKQPRQRLYVLPGNGAKQDQFQHFIIRQRRSTPIAKAGAQAAAMAAACGSRQMRRPMTACLT